jgi:hypothetical protein
MSQAFRVLNLAAIGPVLSLQAMKLTCHTYGMESQPTAVEILDRMSPEEIESRLRDLDSEARALRVLLRAAKQRRRSRLSGAEQNEDTHVE